MFSVFAVLSLHHLCWFAVVLDLVRVGPHMHNVGNGWSVCVERSTVSLSDCSCSGGRYAEEPQKQWQSALSGLGFRL